MMDISFEVVRTPFGFFGKWDCPACGEEQTRIFTLYYDQWPGFLEGKEVDFSHTCSECGKYHHPSFYFRGKTGWAQIEIGKIIRGGVN